MKTKHLYTVSFPRIERDCPHNTMARAGQKDRQIIYDFNVVVDGELRAFWFKEHGSRKYRLLTPRPEAIPIQKVPGDHHTTVEVETQADFHKTINSMLDEGELPTLADLENAKRIRAETKANQEQLQRDQDRLERIEKAGPDLLNALNLLLADWKAMTKENLSRAGKPYSELEWSLYPLARKAMDAIDLATKVPPIG